MTAGSPEPASASASASASAQWRALGVGVQVLVTDRERLAAARDLLAQEIAALDLACSRFRPDSEVCALARADGRRTSASPLFVEAVRVALWAAEATGGAVDPTLGATMIGLGYDRDFASLAATTPATAPGTAPERAVPGVRLRRRAGWRDVELGAGWVRVPSGVLLDLGATAKALGADRAARRLSDELGCGVLVNLGGDLSTAGPAPAGGWAILVQDEPGTSNLPPAGPHQTVAVTSGGLATSSTSARRWQRGGQALHHLIDPVSLTPARTPWRTVSVTAPSCVAANAASTAAIVKGPHGLGFLVQQGLPARLVGNDGHVTVLNGWPQQT